MRISLIIPVYNHAQVLRKCLLSIHHQTMRDTEVIVVDDGSTHGNDVLRRLQKEFAFTFIEIPHGGSNAARNHGFKISNGDFLLFCDADTRLHPQALEKLLAALQMNTAASYAYSSFRRGWKKFRLCSFDADRLKRENFITTTSLIRRCDFPGFDERIARFQDWDLWLTMLTRGKVGVWVPEYLMSFVAHGSHISRWVPRWMFKIPWNLLGLKPRAIRSYEDARAIIAQKHQLSM